MYIIYMCNCLLCLIVSNDSAAQALKCLGFMVYHPVIVSVVSGKDFLFLVPILASLLLI